MDLEEYSKSNGSKDVKLSVCRLNSKLLEDYWRQKDNEFGCHSALTLRYFLLSLELDELKKQKSKCHVFSSDEVNLLPSMDSCSTSKSGLFQSIFLILFDLLYVDIKKLMNSSKYSIVSNSFQNISFWIILR